MNRIFNIIWSKSKERWIVVSEKVKSNGRVPKSLLLSFALLSAMIAEGVPAYALDPGALPTGGEVTSGSATIATSGNQMTINQSTQSMIANWQSFNIGTDAAVRFNQPNSSSTALNRITDQNPTQILGSLSANGKIFLINPSGILFGRDARVDVGGLVASSLDMLDHDFLDGKYSFRNSGNAGAILNQGTINAFQGGVVALIGPSVINEGAITTPDGGTALGAGNQVSLDFDGDGLINLTVDAGAVDALAENKGIIKADGGLVMMTAKAADALTQSAVNNSGIIEANSFQQRAGRIILDAVGGMTTISGALDVSSSGSNGGQIVATGDRVMVTSGAHLTSSGATGGGDVLVGGSWQGKDSSIHQATGTIIESGALLEANATDNGNGGTVVAWSDVTNPLSVTRAYGTFEAQGGPNGGNGGRIETSGHWVDVEGSQGGASATMGASGLWLFDPYNVEITSTTRRGTWSTGDPNIWTPNQSGSRVITTDITSKLLSGTNVKITTTGGADEDGDITVSGAISTPINIGTPTLTLTADGDIIVNANIGNTNGTLNLVMNAGGTISGNSSGTIGVTGFTTFNVGSGSGTLQGVISNTSGLTKSGAGTLILSGANTYTGATTISAGKLTLSSTGTIVASSGVLNNGTFTIAGNKTIDSMTGSGGTALGSYTLTIGDDTDTSCSYSGVISGTGGITKAGDGMLILSGLNTYTGTTSISTGILRAANARALGTTAGGVIVNSGAALELSGGIAIGAEALTLFGSGISSGGALRNISGNNSYAGAITLSSATQINSDSGTSLTLSGKVDGHYALNINGSGSVTLGGTIGDDHPLASFTSNVTTLLINGGSIETSGAQSYNGSTTFGGATTLKNLNNNTGVNNDITATGAVTATAGTLTLQSSKGNVTFTNQGNDFLTVYVDKAASVSLVDKNELTISGIDATGMIDVATLNGNLTISGDVSTTYEPMTASIVNPSSIILNAGKSKDAGTETGGDIKVTGHDTEIRVGDEEESDSHGFVTLYTGSISGSTELAKLIEAGHFRYNSDESTKNYSTELTEGLNLIYREQPKITVKAESETITYGDDPALESTKSGLKNGDTFANAFSGSVVIAVADPTSTSGHYTAGEHTLTPSGLTSLLGYGLTYTNGTLTVDKLALEGSISAGSSIYGSSLEPGSATFTNIVTSEEGTDDLGTATIDVDTTDNLSTSGHFKAGSYTGIESVSALDGTDAGNYTFDKPIGDYSVSKLALEGSIAAGSSIYGSSLEPGSATFTNIVTSEEGTDDLGTATIDVDTTDNLSTSGHFKAGSYTGIESVSALDGTDAGNYTFDKPIGDYSVSKLALEGSIAAGSSIYGSSLEPGSATFTNIVTSEEGTDDLGTATIDVDTTDNLSTSGHFKAGSYTGIESVSALDGTDAGNYTFSDISGDYTVNQKPITISGAF